MKSGEIWLAWGRHKNDAIWEKKCELAGSNLYRLEDGFISYLRHPALIREPLSIITDQTGIYYDTSRSSDLESLISNLSEEQIPKDRVRNIISRIKRQKVSKYNHAHDRNQLPLPLRKSKQRVLVIDQSYQDRSVIYSGANGTNFHVMLQDAIKIYPDAQIIIKSHPDSQLKNKRTYLSNEDCHSKHQLTFLKEDINPWSLLERVDAVFTVSSQMGFEALIAGLPVHCYGHPFYAGWGLTYDHGQAINPNRRNQKTKNISLEVLVYASLLLYPKYRNPESGRLCELEDILDYLDSMLKPHLPYYDAIYSFDLSLWKRQITSSYLKPLYCKDIYHRFRNSITKDRINFDQKRGKAAALFWGYPDIKPAEIDKLRKSGFDILRVEDGFIRSIGLGSDLKRPSSLIFTKHDLPYVAEGAVDIVKMLNQKTFLSEDLLRRAREIRAHIQTNRLTKYNLGRINTQDLEIPKGSQHRCLVIGQVPSDMSLKFAATRWKNDSQLLCAVRDEFPDSEIYYKPHPDIISGNRAGELPEEGLYDKLLKNIDITAAFDLVDSVHVICSLSGFEALIYEKPVFTYGRPFYAGWGLTTDKEEFPERAGPRSLTELIAVSLISLPLYMNWEKYSLCRPETCLKQMSEEIEVKPIANTGSDYLSRFFRKVIFLSETYKKDISFAPFKSRSTPLKQKHNRSA